MKCLFWIISFLIVAFGQPNCAFWIGALAAIFGYALFWHTLANDPLRKRFLVATVWYMFVCLVQLSWMSSTEFQGVYILLVWIGLALWLGLQFGILTLLLPFDRALSIRNCLGIASVWTLFEWLRFYFICGYTWNLAGLCLSNLYAVQMASLFGVLGLSFWVIFTNLLVLRAYKNKQLAIGCLLCALFPYFFGACHLFYHKKQKEKQGFPFYNVVLVQPGLLPSQKIPLQGKLQAFISPMEQWKSILRLLRDKNDSSLVDMIVLPEAAVPFTSDANVYPLEGVEAIFLQIFGEEIDSAFPALQPPFANFEAKKVSNLFWAQTLANFFNSEMILGLDHVEEGKAYNSAFHLLPSCHSVRRYDKQILLPLAEYLPFSWLLPLVKRYGISDFFDRGKTTGLFQGKIASSPFICYEETFPHKVVEGRRLGAKLFVNLTNDGWYPYTSLATQHFEHGRLRTVENGVPLIRACNTGITAVIDSFGNTIKKLDELDGRDNMCKGALVAKVSSYEYFTLFSFWGNTAIISICFTFLFFFIVTKEKIAHLCKKIGKKVRRLS